MDSMALSVAKSETINKRRCRNIFRKKLASFPPLSVEPSVTWTSEEEEELSVNSLGLHGIQTFKNEKAEQLSNKMKRLELEIMKKDAELLDAERRLANKDMEVILIDQARSHFRIKLNETTKKLEQSERSVIICRTALVLTILLAVTTNLSDLINERMVNLW